jgi:hypothetical protein
MPNKGSSRGFASMDAAKQRAIASAGGRAAHRSGNAREFDTQEHVKPAVAVVWPVPPTGFTSEVSNSPMAKA